MSESVREGPSWAWGLSGAAVGAGQDSGEPPIALPVFHVGVPVMRWTLYFEKNTAVLGCILSSFSGPFCPFAPECGGGSGGDVEAPGLSPARGSSAAVRTSLLLGSSGLPRRPAHQVGPVPGPVQHLPHQALLHVQHPHHPAVRPGLQPVRHLPDAVRPLQWQPAGQPAGHLVCKYSGSRSRGGPHAGV